MGTFLRHRDSCQHPATADTLIEVDYCPTCRASDTASAGAFRAAMDWLSHHVEAKITGCHFEENIPTAGAARSWSLSYEIPVMDTKVADDDGGRLLTIAQTPGGHFDITTDTPLALIEPTRTGPSVCYHCIVSKNTQTWDHNAEIQVCSQHTAVEMTCAACNGTGNNSECPPCLGRGTIIDDAVLWAAELLSIDYIPSVMRQGEYWLAAQILHSAEADPQHWTVQSLLEVFGGITMLSQPGYPWSGERFAVLAQETIADAVAMLLRKEITTQKSALAANHS